MSPSDQRRDEPSWASLPERLARVWEQHASEDERAQLVAWLAFGATFGVTRGITYSLRGRGGSGGIVLRGRHIHHYNFGIALLSIVGAVALRPERRPGRRPRLATAYGTGTALIVDEAALLLDLKDVYWANDGRRSVDAAVGIIATAGAYLAAAPFWEHAAREVKRTRPIGQ